MGGHDLQIVHEDRWEMFALVIELSSYHNIDSGCEFRSVSQYSYDG